MGVNRLERKHKVTVIGRLNWQDGGEATGAVAQGLTRVNAAFPTTTAPERARRSCPRTGKQ